MKYVTRREGMLIAVAIVLNVVALYVMAFVK